MVSLQRQFLVLLHYLTILGRACFLLVHRLWLLFLHMYQYSNACIAQLLIFINSAHFSAGCIHDIYFFANLTVHFQYLNVNTFLHAYFQLTSLLSEIGLNIQEAHAFSTTDGYSLDVFVVDGWVYEVLTLFLVVNLCQQ